MSNKVRGVLFTLIGAYFIVWFFIADSESELIHWAKLIIGILEIAYGVFLITKKK